MVAPLLLRFRIFSILGNLGCLAIKAQDLGSVRRERFVYY